MAKLVKARTCIWRNPRQRVGTFGIVNQRTGRLVTSSAGDRVNPGETFEATEEEYNDLLKAGAIEDVENDTDTEADLIG